MNRSIMLTASALTLIAGPALADHGELTSHIPEIGAAFVVGSAMILGLCKYGLSMHRDKKED